MKGQILLVDDVSRDATREILQRIAFAGAIDAVMSTQRNIREHADTFVPGGGGWTDEALPHSFDRPLMALHVSLYRFFVRRLHAATELSGNTVL
mgnify:CR=1 FL=1